ncbi:MAG: cold shock domain-containing protein [Acidobacteriota bacterium]
MPEQGIVKWYSIAKGYGFIRREPGAAEAGRVAEAGTEDAEGASPRGTEDTDIFVHYSDLSTAALEEGERVSFEVVSGPRGLKARNVALAEGPA